MNRRGFLSALIGAPVTCALTHCGQNPLDTANASLATGGKVFPHGAVRQPFLAMVEPGETICLRPLAEALIPHLNAAISDGNDLKIV